MDKLAIHEGQTFDYECKIAKFIADNCVNLKNININGKTPKVFNHGKEIIIDFKQIMLTFKNIKGIDEDLLKQSYQSLIRMTIPMTNDAIMGAIEEYSPSCSMGFSYEEDFRTGVYKIIVTVRDFTKESGIVNEMAAGDYISLLESEKDDTKFEYYASDTFIMDATRGDSPRKMRKYASKAQKFLNTTGAKIEARPYKMNGYKHQFNINYGSPESIIKGSINKLAYKHQTKSMTMFTKNQIAQMKTKAEKNIARLNKIADEMDKATKLKHEAGRVSIDKILTEASNDQLSKQYTSLPYAEFKKTFRDAKNMYLRMVACVTEKYKPIDGVYTPGWDTADWPDSPDKFFDTMIKYIYTTEYQGKKYAQFSIVIAEIDNAKRKPNQVREILAICDKLVDFKYRMDVITAGNPGWYITPIAKNNGYSISICLNSNDYLVK